MVGHFPGDLVVKNLPANAGDVGSTTGPGTKTRHGELSPGTTITAVALQREAAAMRSPHIATRGWPFIHHN